MGGKKRICDEGEGVWLGSSGVGVGADHDDFSGAVLNKYWGQRYSLSQQVLNFESTLDQLRPMMSGANMTKYLAKSIAVLEFGSNDYINNYLLPSLYSSSYIYTPPAFANLLVNRYTQQILALHSVGLRKFVLAGIGPLGCIPNQRALAQPGRCVDYVNQILGSFNEGLRSLANQLNTNHPGAIFVYANTYAAFGDMLNNPALYAVGEGSPWRRSYAKLASSSNAQGRMEKQAEEEGGDDGFAVSSGISRPLSEILRQLNKKVPDSLVKTRSESGFTSKYIPWHIVNRIMNLHAPEWSGEVRSITYSADAKSVSVVYRVTLYGTDAEIFRESTGTASVDDTSFGDPVQKAEAMAFHFETDATLSYSKRESKE
ncbi:hypothetical protein GBA52_026269 [Prunus armeniaca]|nr:hypothetical protein GBA52_026269 [Prunus armeniaca]